MDREREAVRDTWLGERRSLSFLFSLFVLFCQSEGERGEREAVLCLRELSTCTKENPMLFKSI